VRPRVVSLVARAAWAALLSAGIAAALAAIGASAFADALLVHATDTRLLEAATELGRKLDASPEPASTSAVVDSEQEEATSTGIVFAVFGPDGTRLGGESHVPLVPNGQGECTTVNPMRLCRIAAGGQRQVVAATFQGSRAKLFAFAALGAVALAGSFAWLLGWLLSRRAVAPLVRLQSRIADMHLEMTARPLERPGHLGPEEGVSEVDGLRRAIALLLSRMHDTLDRSARFAANAAHELRTPLTVLRGELELLAEETASSSNASTSIHRALRKVVHVQSLTERLLVLATPETTQDDACELVSLRDVVEEVVADLEAGDRARVEIPDGPDVLVRGDSSALGIIVSNALSNALKFGRHALLEIGVEGTYALVTVEDDGPGVAEADRESVFEPFTRGADAHRIPGYGLGLAIVAHVAKRHGGRARLVTARRGPTGARLEVRIPRASPSNS